MSVAASRWRGSGSGRVSGGGRLPKQLTGLLTAAALVGSGLVLTAAPAAAAVPDAAAPQAAAAPKTPPVASRPDLVSAALTARSQGSQVEVESARTSRSTTWVNPDGTTTVEAHAAPVRFRQGAAWRDVDLTLQQNPDGSVSPRAQPDAVKVTDSATAAGSITAGAGAGRQVTLGLPGRLGKPVLDGTRATYPDVTPGVDLTVEARGPGSSRPWS